MPDFHRFAHILHPTDLGADGDLAFDHALRLALADRCELSIVHTGRGPDLGDEWSRFPQVRERLARWGLLPLDALREAVQGLGIHVHKTDLGAVDPGRALAEYVHTRGCDLVVLANHPRHGLARWARPSVSQPLARRAGVATLFLPDGARGFVEPGGTVRLNNILIPVDVTPDPLRAVAKAAALARRLGAEDAVLHLLHIGSGHPVITARDLHGMSHKWRTAEGPVADTIDKIAAELDVDLIVMATHGHEGFLDALRGSTTEQVVRRCRRPLLAIPA